jgi:ABC-type Zn2+ transport system substrate-binding protein/surface adhesin
MDSEMNHDQGPNITLWLGIAIGAAVGIGIALSRRKRSPWDQARKITTRLGDHSGDFADATSNIMQRVKTIYDEGCKVVEEAGELWSHGRRLVSR